MTKPLTFYNCDTKKTNSQDAALWDEVKRIFSGFEKTAFAKELKPVFDNLHDEELIEALKRTRWTGRPGYPIKVMWRTIIASYVLNFPTFASLIRNLHNNPLLALTCGITSYDGIPTKYAYSRFIGKLSQPYHVVMVKNVMRSLTRSLYETLPDFGKSVAIDSTDLKAWSNGAKKPKADSDASWSVKLDTSGKKKFYYGYRLHLMTDTQYELPVAANVVTASTNDVIVASRVLGQARFTYSKFHPQYVICDAGYSSNKLRHLIKRQYRAKSIIKANPTHKIARIPETKEFQALYCRRSSIERVFGRLKGHKKLNNITVRYLPKVTVHCFLSLIVVQAQALYAATTNQESSMRQCV